MSPEKQRVHLSSWSFQIFASSHFLLNRADNGGGKVHTLRILGFFYVRFFLFIVMFSFLDTMPHSYDVSHPNMVKKSLAKWVDFRLIYSMPWNYFSDDKYITTTSIKLKFRQFFLLTKFLVFVELLCTVI